MTDAIRTIDTPKGIIKVNIFEPYQIDQITTLSPTTLNYFTQLLGIKNTLNNDEKEYELLEVLSDNNLLYPDDIKLFNHKLFKPLFSLNRLEINQKYNGWGLDTSKTPKGYLIRLMIASDDIITNHPELVFTNNSSISGSNLLSNSLGSRKLNLDKYFKEWSIDTQDAPESYLTSLILASNDIINSSMDILTLKFESNIKIESNPKTKAISEVGFTGGGVGKLPLKEDTSSKVYNIPEIRYPVNGDIPEDIVLLKRNKIKQILLRDAFSGDSQIKNLTSNDIQVMFNLYDKEFFDGKIKGNLNKLNAKLTFDTSNAMTSAAGKCTSPKCVKTGCSFNIRMSNAILLNLFKRGEPFLKTNGIKCTDRLTCLQLVFEHELIHLAIRSSPYSPSSKIKGDKIYSSHGKLFKDLVYAYFKHTGVTHSLLNNTTECDDKPLTCRDFYVGQEVEFDIPKKGHYVATIQKIKREFANVLTDRGEKFGVRCSIIKPKSK